MEVPLEYFYHGSPDVVLKALNTANFHSKLGLLKSFLYVGPLLKAKL